MQQVQPHLSIVETQSQQAWIISQHLASPLVQVSETPSLVISQWHMPIVRLQQHTIMPFISMQQLHIPPANIEQRFCTMLHAILSSQLQVIFMPPVHFSIFMVHRGTIIMLAIGGVVVPAEGAIPMPGIPIPMRSIIMALVM